MGERNLSLLHSGVSGQGRRTLRSLRHLRMMRGMRVVPHSGISWQDGFRIGLVDIVRSERRRRRRRRRRMVVFHSRVSGHCGTFRIRGMLVG